MQLLNGCKADIDVVFVDTLEIIHLRHGDRLPFKTHVLTEKVFCSARVEEVILCLFDDIGRVDEKEEVAVAFLIEVEDQACHDKCFAAAGRHVEQQMNRFFFSR